MPHGESLLGLSGYEEQSVEGLRRVEVKARYVGPVRCPYCESERLRKKDRFVRRVRHTNIGVRPCHLELEACKYRCLSCGKYFNQRFPGIGPRRRYSELFRQQIVREHREGISQHTIAEREGLGSATVERWYHEALYRKNQERIHDACPRVLGIDEHFFTRKAGFATTLCDLGRRRVFDVVLGRSEKALEGYFNGLIDKHKVLVVAMDLATNYRSLVRKHFPRALIVADRFHVIRLINHHFLATWSQLDPKGRANRGLLSLVRRHDHRLSEEQRRRLAVYLQEHPAFRIIYDFKQRLCRLLSLKHCTARRCRRLVPFLIQAIDHLKSSAFPSLAQLGQTLDSWRDEIARMWRFTKNNGITEGFHTKMEMISRRAFGFRNFENYRLRVKVLCG